MGQHFAHLHNNRVAWLEARVASRGRLAQLDGEPAADRAALLAALHDSAAAMRDMLARAQQEGRMPAFKRSPTAFLGYLIAHEAAHLGEVGVILAQNGRRLPREVAMGMWDWSVR